MAEVQLKHVHKAFGTIEVIKGVDLDLRDGEFIVFVGPSGCGKSTLLRLIAGLEDITSGDLYIDSSRVNDLPPSRRGISMVFQSYALFPHMTVEENMSFGLRLAKAPKEEIDSKVKEAASILQLEQLLHRKPKDLSGGQRQRVAIGRSIVRHPKVFLFDEPLSNLDAALRVQMRIEIARLHKQLAAIMIYVTHDQVEAMTLADRIVVLNAGLVEQVGSPLELYHHPRNLFVAGFIGSPKMNFIETTASATDDHSVSVHLPGGTLLKVPCKGASVRSGDPVTLGARPEDLSVDGSGDAHIGGKALVVERLGGETYTYVQLDDGTMITVKSDRTALSSAGQPLNFGIHADTCHIFTRDGLAVERLDRTSFTDQSQQEKKSGRLIRMKLGVCYYPEHWPKETWASDAARMRALGLEYVRIGEFAWSRLEPEAGRWDWLWLDEAIDTLHHVGLKIILGTPTATPPKWLIDGYPEMLPVGADGRTRGFGSRRHYCFSSPVYREQCRRIVTALAQRYGRHPALVAWQTDNEYGCHDTVLSYSEAAMSAFRDWLKQRYGHIDALNQAWGTVFWSQEYRSFDEIDAPVGAVTEANPSQRLDYRRFASDQVGEF